MQVGDIVKKKDLQLFKILKIEKDRFQVQDVFKQHTRWINKWVLRQPVIGTRVMRMLIYHKEYTIFKQLFELYKKSGTTDNVFCYMNCHAEIQIALNENNRNTLEFIFYLIENFGYLPIHTKYSIYGYNVFHNHLFLQLLEKHPDVMTNENLDKLRELGLQIFHSYPSAYVFHSYADGYAIKDFKENFFLKLLEYEPTNFDNRIVDILPDTLKDKIQQKVFDIARPFFDVHGFDYYIIVTILENIFYNGFLEYTSQYTKGYYNTRELLLKRAYKIGDIRRSKN